MEELLDSLTEPVVITFTAVNCGPCRLQKQELATFKRMLGDDHNGNSLRMLSIDTEKWPAVGTRFEVRKLPCVVVLKDKEVVARLEGLTSAEVLVERIRSFL